MRPQKSIIVCERKLDFNLNIRRVKSETENENENERMREWDGEADKSNYCVCSLNKTIATIQAVKSNGNTAAMATGRKQQQKQQM